MLRRAGWTVPVWVCAFVAFVAQCVVFCAGISKFIEDDVPTFAQAIYPLNVTARLQNSLAGIEAGADIADHAADIRRFLVAAPDDARFYSLLGIAETRLGDKRTAATLFDAALRLSQTEQNAAINVIATKLGTRDTTQALQRADILLRRWPGSVADLAPVLLKIALESEKARNDLLVGLEKRPAWRWSFMNQMISSRAALFLLPRFFAALQNTSGPPSDQEVALAAQALIMAGHPRLAYQLYILTRDKTEQSLAGLVYDSKFRKASNGSAFDWRLANTSGVDISLPAAADGGAKFEFLDQPAVGAGMSQTLLLFPGDYVLSVKIDAHGLVTPDALTVSMECRSGQKLVALKIPAGTYEEKTLSLPVSVPEQCDLQELRLQSVQIAPRWSRPYSGDLLVREITLAYATDG